MIRAIVSVSMFLVVVAGLAGCASPGERPAAPAEEPAPPASASAALESRSGSSVTGTATFTAEGGVVTMVVDVAGLTPGEHAIHLHEKGDCSAPDATSAGPHWNPGGHDHGKWGAEHYHLGDIGNLVAAADGKATLTFSTDLWTVGGAPETDVVGRSVIVHAAADDFTTQPTGNAGGRVACGVVRAKS